MEAMTMEFPIHDPKEYQKLAVGKQITASCVCHRTIRIGSGTSSQLSSNGCAHLRLSLDVHFHLSDQPRAERAICMNRM